MFVCASCVLCYIARYANERGGYAGWHVYADWLKAECVVVISVGMCVCAVCH